MWSALNESLSGQIFISYRRQETAWPVGRLYDKLVEHFPAEQIFRDVDSIEPGEDFVERITATVSSCDVLLALIGPQWLKITDEEGRCRLDNPGDYVRVEIETALTRKIRVIPILVDDAQMPRVNELPSTLAALVRRNAVEINPITFDTTRLIAAVQQTLAEEQARREADVQVQQQADVQARQQADVQARQQAEERARQQAEERAQQRAEDQNRRQIGRPPRALVWSWVLLVGLVVGPVIGYVLWGGAGALLAAIMIVPAVVVWGWQRRHRPMAGTSTRAEADAAADRLAEQTLETWSRQVVQRGIHAPAPVRVRWHWAADKVALPRQELAAAPLLPTDPGPLPSGADDLPQVLNSGLVTRLHDEVYARLHHGRLVLIGDPGAGKTAAMILLLLEALRYRQRMPETARTDVPVPVWLTLGSWDPGVQGLRDWVTATMGRDHPYLRAIDFGPNAAAQLFDTGRIALFLDGLDEMPDTLRGEALERLAAEAAGRRVVITSRGGEFRGTLDTGRELPYTAVVVLRPVGPPSAARYLLEGQVGATRLAWQQVADHLLAHPDGVLARTLNTPLTLSLARSAYKGSDPCGLLADELADERALRVHLLDQVLVAAYPDARERTYATYWLGWLAHHMSTQPNGPTRDLPWWHVPGWIPQGQFGLVRGGVVGLLVGLLAGLLGGPLVGLLVGLLGGFTLELVLGLAGAGPDPRSLTIRWPTRKDLASGLVVWFSVGLVLVLVLAFLYGFELWLAVALGLGLLLKLVAVWREPLAETRDATPRLIHRKDVASQLIGGLVVGLVGGLLVGLVVGLAYTPVQGPADRLEHGLLVGLLVGFVVGLVVGLSGGASSSLLFTEIALWLRGRRVRFMPLLETALARQILRQAGVVYQFRHADLQDRLAYHYEVGLTVEPAA
jgi:hypothetical protein